MQLGINQLSLTGTRSARAATPLKTDLNIITLPGSIVATAQGVHFKADPIDMAVMATARGMALADFTAECEFLTEFSLDDAREDYAFQSLPADHMGGKTAGWALGPYAAHAYLNAGSHRARHSIYWRGNLIAEGEKTITVAERDYPLALQGYLATTLPVAGADGVPVGVTNLFTDVAAAINWVCGAEGRALYIRRGQTFNHTTQPTNNVLRLNATVGSYDATGPNPSAPSEARPRIDVDFGYPGVKIEAVGDGTSKDFVADSLTTEILVYFDNALQTEGVGYTRSGTTITAAPGVGVTIRVFNLEVSGAKRVLQLRAPSVFLMSARTNNPSVAAIVRDVEFVGQANPADPGFFDPADLSTAYKGGTTNGVGGAGVDDGLLSSVTLFRADFRRFHLCFTADAPTGNCVGAFDCNFDEWANYAVFLDKISQTVFVGCSMRQSDLAVRGTQARSFNTLRTTVATDAEALNASWHGPMRNVYALEAVVNCCRLNSKNSWIGSVGAAQPITRFLNSNIPAQSYTLTQNHTTGGEGVFGGDRQNEWWPRVPHGPIHVGYNVFGGYASSPFIGNGSIWAATFSNLFVRPAGMGGTGPTAYFSKLNSTTGLSEVFGTPKPWLSVNDTVLLLDSRPATFTLNGTEALAAAGIQNAVSVIADLSTTRGGYPVPSGAWGTATVRVPVNIDTLTTDADRFYTRIFRGPNEAAAVWQDTRSARAEVYHFQYQTGALNQDWTGEANEIAGSQWIDVTLKSGTWAEGDIVWVTREPTLDNGDVFYTNNRAEPLIRAPATLHNTVLVAAGTWDAIEVDGAVVADPSIYAPAAYGAWDASWRPVAGNAVIGAASSIRSAFDVRGRLRTGRAKGALEPDTDLTGWPAIPAVPGVAVSLDPATYTGTGDFTTANVVATIDPAGSPALTSGDITKAATVADSFGTPKVGSAYVAGDRLTGSVLYGHPTLPPRQTASTTVSVASPAFEPIWINTNPLADSTDGATISAATPIAMPTPTAGANQHVAFRFRVNRPVVHVNGPPRIFWSSNASNNSYVLLRDNGTMTVQMGTAAQTTIATGIPTTGDDAASVSVLLSAYLNGDGPTDYLPSGDGVIAWTKVGAGAPTPFAVAQTPLVLFSTFLNVFVSSAIGGIPDVDFQQYYGLWTGGITDWNTFFDADGTVKQWAANPTLGVSGMSQHFLLNGVGSAAASGTFEFYRPAARRPWLAV